MAQVSQREHKAQLVFIVGPLRSGTTLLRLLLDHHSSICIFGEFEASVSQAREESWPDIASYREFLSADRQSRAYELNIDESLEYVPLVKSLFGQLVARTSKPIVGAAIHSRADMLPKIWPEAKYIHLLRDPRDVAKSCIGMGWVGNVYEGAVYWLKPERHWDLLVTQVPAENTCTVRYEELVNDPESVLRSLCQFLGQSYEPRMLEIEADTTYCRPDPKLASQWRNSLSPKEISWVESRCANLMFRRGYEVTTKNLKPRSWICNLGLKLQSRLYRVQFNIHRWGLLNWSLYISSQRLGPSWLKKRAKLRIDSITLKHLK